MDSNTTVATACSSEQIIEHDTLQEPAFQLVLLLWDSDNYMLQNNHADHFPLGLYSEEIGKYCMYFCK